MFAVIGGGPAGYTAAVELAKNGHKVTLIEKEYMGGACLNYGCIPTKYLLENAGRREYSKVAFEMGRVISNLRKGIDLLFEKNSIRVITGTASFSGRNTIKVGSDELEAEKIIIAVGTKPFIPEPLIHNNDLVVDSDKALYIREIPQKIIIIGGGFVGMELAQIFNALGSSVAVVEKQKQIMPGWDAELVKELSNELTRKGVNIYTDCWIESISNQAGDSVIAAMRGSSNLHLQAGLVVVCVNRVPALDLLGLESAGIKLRNGAVEVDEYLNTTVRDIFCAGDARAGSNRLAYTAYEEGVIAARNAMGARIKLEEYAVPAVLYTSPEIGSVGATEVELINSGVVYKKSVSLFASNPMAHIRGYRRGWVKALSAENRLLGVQAAGSGISELINCAAVIIKSKIDLRGINRGLFTHPSFGETLFEALNGHSS